MEIVKFRLDKQFYEKSLSKRFAFIYFLPWKILKDAEKILKSSKRLTLAGILPYFFFEKIPHQY